MTDPVPVGIDVTKRPTETKSYLPITMDMGFDAGRRLETWQFENESEPSPDTFRSGKGMYISDRWNTPNMWWLRYADRDRRAPYTAYMDDFHRWADVNDQLAHDFGLEEFQIRPTRVPSLQYVMSIVGPDIRRP